MQPIRFWNGNKSAVRQTFELTLLHRVLNVCGGEIRTAGVVEDRTDYPNARDEGAIFKKGLDVCVTVAGNPKFTPGSFLSVDVPLMNGLLGHRLLIVRDEDQSRFATIKSALDLQTLTAGIPETWADAPLFRANNFEVNERGSFDEIFQRLKNRECDYVSLGANEIHAVFAEKAQPLGGLVIEPSLRLYYPFALVFYVHPEQPELANQLAEGLNVLKSGGEFETLFQDFFATSLSLTQLHQRKEITLKNDALPTSLEQQMAVVSQQLLQEPTTVP